MAFLHAGHGARVLRQQVFSTLIVVVGVVDGRHLVTVAGHIPVDAVVEILANSIVPVECEFHTRVAHGARILPLGVLNACRGRYLHLHKQVFGLLIIPVKRCSQPTAKEAGVNTEVGLLGCFPCQVGIGQTCEIGSLCGTILDIAKRVAAKVAIDEGRQIAEAVAYILITVLSPAGTKFQEIEPTGCGLHKPLIANHPTGTDRREVAPLLAFEEAR